jgi:hypothetical protein
VVSRELTRSRVALGALAAGEVLVVAAVAAAYGTDGRLSTAVALLVAPAAVVATFVLAERLAGTAFGLAAATTYVVLPLLGTIYMFATYRSTFTHDAIPELVGLRATPWFALGVALAVLAPVRVTAPAFIALGAVAVVQGAGDLSTIQAGLHETAWSITMLVWLVVAGVLGALRRSRSRAAILAGWLAFAVFHGARGGYDGAAFWQSLSIATPAIAVLLSSIGLLAPRLRAAPAPRRAH